MRENYRPIKKINVNKSSKDEILTLINNEIKESGRYIVGCNIGQEGHVLIIEKLSDVNILYYDPQKISFLINFRIYLLLIVLKL